jgi:hypothetical protein
MLLADDREAVISSLYPEVAVESSQLLEEIKEFFTGTHVVE